MLGQRAGAYVILMIREYGMRIVYVGESKL